MIFKVLIVVIICTELYERSVAPHPYQLLEWFIVFFFFIKRILSKIPIWSLHTPAEIFYCFLSLKILKEALNILYFCCRIFLLTKVSLVLRPNITSSPVFYPIYQTAAAAAKLLQSCPTLCNPIDGSLPGSSIHGIFQARALEWGAIAFSNISD